MDRHAWQLPLGTCMDYLAVGIHIGPGDLLPETRCIHLANTLVLVEYTFIDNHLSTNNTSSEQHANVLHLQCAVCGSSVSRFWITNLIVKCRWDLIVWQVQRRLLHVRFVVPSSYTKPPRNQNEKSSSIVTCGLLTTVWKLCRAALAVKHGVLGLLDDKAVSKLNHLKPKV